MRKAFTLIELLVVIVIIGVIATMSTIALTSMRSRARDSKRISDLKQIATTLELYYADHNAYPTTLTFGSALVGASNGKTYMAKVPTNPTPRAEGACADIEYQYAGSTSDFSLIGCLAKASGDAPAGARRLSGGGSARDLGPTDGIVGWWTLDGLYTSGGVAADISGNNNGGTITGATLTTNQLGQANKAYNFNGSSDVISFGDVDILKNKTEFTITGWYKRNTGGVPNGFLQQYIDLSNIISFGYVNNYNRVGLRMNADLGYFTFEGTGTWQHYAAVFNGNLSGNANRLKFYRNGVSESLTFSGTIPATSPSISADLTLGKQGASFRESDQSDVRIYNRALSDVEVTALYEATKP